jgi:hypothetical protein
MNATDTAFLAVLARAPSPAPGGRVASWPAQLTTVATWRPAALVHAAQHVRPDFAVTPSAIQVVTPYNLP